VQLAAERNDRLHYRLGIAARPVEVLHEAAVPYDRHNQFRAGGQRGRMAQFQRRGLLNKLASRIIRHNTGIKKTSN
jgi:hypothetical protein